MYEAEHRLQRLLLQRLEAEGRLERKRDRHLPLIYVTTMVGIFGGLAISQGVTGGAPAAMIVSAILLGLIGLLVGLAIAPGKEDSDTDLSKLDSEILEAGNALTEEALRAKLAPGIGLTKLDQYEELEFLTEPSAGEASPRKRYSVMLKSDGTLQTTEI